MVTDWRRIFNQGNPNQDNLPFYYVQMTPYAASYFQTDPWGDSPKSNDYAFFRETQAAVRKLLPHTEMAVTMDVDEIINIHWRAKRLVGERLSGLRSEEHTSELQSLMRISYAVFCLKQKTTLLNSRKYSATRMATYSYKTNSHVLLN